ncbi:hypothetical protein ACFFGQ_12030, partial [Rufibacter quisquiliarum]|uniref:hypothetical protein n=1 Tax=Rufibacter quisquiliarum TaxID=1549639 RepID=UPI0035EE7F96
ISFYVYLQPVVQQAHCVKVISADGLARFLAKTVGGQFRQLQNPSVLKLAENRSLTVHYSAYTTEIQQTNI